MKTTPKILDNNRIDLLSCIQSISADHQYLSIATGYWNLRGTQDVYEHISNYKKIRLLIGREPLIPRHKRSEPEPDYPDKDFFFDLEQMQPSDTLKTLVKNIKQLIEKNVLEVRVKRLRSGSQNSYI